MRGLALPTSLRSADVACGAGGLGLDVGFDQRGGLGLAAAAPWRRRRWRAGLRRSPPPCARRSSSMPPCSRCSATRLSARAASLGIERLDQRARKRGRRARRIGRQPLELGAERLRAQELVAQPAPPALRNVGCAQQRVEQRHVADAQLPARQPRLLQRAQHQHQRARIRFAGVLVAERFDAGLAELARVGCVRTRRLKAEGRPVVAVVGLRSASRMPLQIEPARRHGEVGPQAQLLAVQVGEHVGASAQGLADHVEEHPGRLDDVGRNGLVAGGDEHRQQRAGLRLEGLEICWRRSAHDHCSALRVPSFGRGRAARQGPMMPVGRSLGLDYV